MSQTRLLRFLRQLHERGPVNAYAIAVILTESHFRGPFYRLCELAFAVMMLDLFHKTPRVTLGKCQVGLAHWQGVFGSRTSVLVRAVLNDICNYDVCCAYLSTRSCSSLREVAVHYNGKPSHLYIRLFRLNLLAVIAAIERLKIECSEARFDEPPTVSASIDDLARRKFRNS